MENKMAIDVKWTGTFKNAVSNEAIKLVHDAMQIIVATKSPHLLKPDRGIGVEQMVTGGRYGEEIITWGIIYAPNLILDIFKAIHGTIPGSSSTPTTTSTAELNALKAKLEAIKKAGGW